MSGYPCCCSEHATHLDNMYTLLLIDKCHHLAPIILRSLHPHCYEGVTAFCIIGPEPEFLMISIPYYFSKQDGFGIYFKI